MLLCPSLMCADYGNLRATVEELDAAGIDIFHCDVMDGSFVPNFAMGLEDIKAVRAATNKLVDVHLMVENPASKVELFAAAGADIIYIHPESLRGQDPRRDQVSWQERRYCREPRHLDFRG